MDNFKYRQHILDFNQDIKLLILLSNHHLMYPYLKQITKKLLELYTGIFGEKINYLAILLLIAYLYPPLRILISNRTILRMWTIFKMVNCILLVWIVF